MMKMNQRQDTLSSYSASQSDSDTGVCSLAGGVNLGESTHETAMLQPEANSAQQASVGVSVCHNEPRRLSPIMTSPKLSARSFADDADNLGRKNSPGVPLTQQEFGRKTLSGGALGKPVLPFNKNSIKNMDSQSEEPSLSSRTIEETTRDAVPSGDGCLHVNASRHASSSSPHLLEACATNSPKIRITGSQMGEASAGLQSSGAIYSAPRKGMANVAQMESNLRTSSRVDTVVRGGNTSQQERSSETLRRLPTRPDGTDYIVHHGLAASPSSAARSYLLENHRVSSTSDGTGNLSCSKRTQHRMAHVKKNGCSVLVEQSDSGGDSPQSFFVFGHRLFSKSPSTREHTYDISHQTMGRNIQVHSTFCSCNGSCNTKCCSCGMQEDAEEVSSHKNTDNGVVQKRHIWLRRIRGTPFSVCENCGTPFDIRSEGQEHNEASNGHDNRHRWKDHSREREDMHPHLTKGLNGQQKGLEKRPTTTRGNNQQLASLCSALVEGPNSEGEGSSSERFSRSVSRHLGRQLPFLPVASCRSSCAIQEGFLSGHDRDRTMCSRASSASTRTSADINGETLNGLPANSIPDTPQSRYQRADVLVDDPRCELSEKGTSSLEEVRTTLAICSSNTENCVLPLGEQSCVEELSPISRSSVTDSRRLIDERGCTFPSLHTRHQEKMRKHLGGNTPCSDSDNSDGSSSCRCYSLQRTESLFPTCKESASDGGDGYRNRKETGANEDEGMCSCSSALESLKGVTWGWGFQNRPHATLSYYFGELKSGLAVPMSQLPATMTCAIIANVPVAAALHGAWITGLISAVFGGSPLSITTVTSSLAVTLAKVTRTTCDEATNVCHEEGLEFIFPALVLAGFCCFVFGLLRLSRFSQFVPSATIVGYLNAVAILNVRAQVETFRFDPVTSTGYEWLWVLLMIIVVFGVMCCWEKIPRIKVNRFIPSSFLAVALSSLIEFVFVRRIAHMQTKTVASLSTMTEGDLWPKPFFLTPENIKPLSFYMHPSNLMTMLELTLALVMVNYISTLITVDMMSDKVGHMRSEPDQHLVSVGAANTVACFLGALPGSTAPSPSLLNLKVGGKGRESSIFCALVNLALVAASTYLLEYVPLGGLAGIIMYTAYHAFQWRAVAAMFASFLPARLRKKHPVLQRKICRSDAFVMLLTTVIAISADIGTAILSGICISACVFAWKNGSRLSVTSRIDPESGIKYYRVKGPIFFLTKRKLLRSFDIEHDPPSVVFELTGDACQLFDFGAMETLDTIVARYRKKNKRVRVVGMQHGDKKMIIKAGRMFEFAQIDIVERSIDEGEGPHIIPPIADMMKLPC